MYRRGSKRNKTCELEWHKRTERENISVIVCLWYCSSCGEWNETVKVVDWYGELLREEFGL